MTLRSLILLGSCLGAGYARQVGVKSRKYLDCTRAHQSALGQVLRCAFQSPCALGFDFGTSGLRIAVLDEKRNQVFEAVQGWTPPSAVQVKY